MNLLSTKICIVFVTACCTQSISADTKFNNEYIGVVFEPYTKIKTSEAFRDDVSEKEIEDMLNLVTTKFNKISTFGIGTRDANSPWDKGNGAAFTPIVASRINKNKNRLAINLYVGAWTAWSSFSSQEIQNALDASNAANKVFNGTVSGVAITEPLHDDDSKFKTLDLIKKKKDSAMTYSLKLGVRAIGHCEGLIKDLQNPPKSVTVDLLKSIDFIICSVLEFVTTNVSGEVEKMGNLLKKAQKEFRTIHPNIEIIGEIGWPSVSKTEKNDRSSLVRFWKEMTQWATTNRFRVNMFTAFDELWKDDEKQFGIGGQHFGWWERIRNGSSGSDAFIEKEAYVEPVEPPKSHAVEITFGVIGAIFVLALIAGMGFLYRKLRSAQNALLTKSEIEAFENGYAREGDTDDTEEALLLPYDRSFEIPKGKLFIDQGSLLGSGAFGRVFKGKVDGHSKDVACKLTQSNITSTSLKSLLSEIKIMIHVGKHENVVSIIGAYTGEMRKGIVMIATELCEQGSLEKHLRSMKETVLLEENGAYQNENVIGDRYVNAPTSTLTSTATSRVHEKLLKWSHEIACGMEHIASKKVIHADLATRNVLLDFDGTAKITDFGLSRRLYEYSNYVKQNQEPLPWRWMALESLQQLTFSAQSDVWSFGVTLFEIFSLGNVPFPGLNWDVNFTEKLANGIRMSKPKNATNEIYSIMMDCWHLLPENRPLFSGLVNMFEKLVREFNHADYLENIQQNKQEMN